MITPTMQFKDIASYFTGLLLLAITFTSCTKNFDEQLVQQQPESAIQTAASTTASTETIKTINVNIFGGVNSYTATNWNNWNTSASLTSGVFNYTDGTSSTVTAAIGLQTGVGDNGTGYTTTMAPKEVGRYASFSTSTRNLTLSGLDSTKTYDLDIYASRAGTSNNTTRFTAAGKIIDVKTDNNLATPALFTSLKSAAGKIVVKIDKLTTYNYINGFSLREKSGTTTDVTPPPDTIVTVDPVPSGKVYTLQRNTGNDIYIPDASSRGWKGGDTLRIPAGNYHKIVIGNFQGNATNPIVIINYGGQVVASQITFDNNASYFKLTGAGDPSITYGFKVANSGNLVGIGVGLAHHVEVCNVEVTGAEVGFIFKKNPISTDSRSIAPNYVLSNYKIHHNYLHDIKNEGMYIGHTAPDGDPARNYLLPLRMDQIEIAYNIVSNTGWDGIQLSNARNGAKIHHNTVTNYGSVNAGSQQAGIIMGGNTTGDIYDNVVTKGTGNGIQAFGYGTIRIFNNTVENAGVNGSADGVESVFCNDLITTTETNPKQQILFYKNTIKFPKPKGGLRVGAYKSNSLPSSITDNTVYLLNAPVDWLKWYLVTHVAGSTISSNTVVR